jgi:ABC-type uncharacterized transport system permease subunit
MISGITITCFAASYLVTLVLEVTRLFFRAPVRMAVMIGFAAAGLLAHSMYLWAQAQADMARQIAPLSSWYHWCLIAAWVVVAAYIVLTLFRPQTVTGLFLLPLALALIAVSAVFRQALPFSAHEAYFRWGMIHGLALLLGTATVMLGFVAGVMYLVQSYRLKQKIPSRLTFKLPSLEWLQQINRLSLYVSTCLLAAGLLAGIVLNLIRQASQSAAVPWSDPVVVTSGILLVWLVAASLFELFYKPARQGQKVAYLTVASFIFLGLVLGILRFSPSEHTGPKPHSAASAGLRTLTRSASEAGVPFPRLRFGLVFAPAASGGGKLLDGLQTCPTVVIVRGQTEDGR